MKPASFVVPFPLLVLIFTVLPGQTAFAGDDAANKGLLTSQIEYWSVGHLGERNDEGWLLAWKGTVSGDLAGELRYWFSKAPPAPEGTYSNGKVGYYMARWELWHDGKLVLAGDSAGKTVIPDGQDGIWDGHGIVTEASGDLNSLKGRRIYETGTVIFPSDAESPPTGAGMFVVY